MVVGKNLFERLQEKQLQQLEKEQPPITIPKGPLLRPEVPPTDNNSPPIERLLDFLVNRWRRPEIRIREICQFGPGSIRDRKSAIALTEILAQNGWLAPLPPTRQHNEKLWRIVRGGQT